MIDKLRLRIRGLCRQLLNTVGLAKHVNGGSAIESESALYTGVKTLCAQRRVVGWQDHLDDVLVPTVAFEWTKHQVLHGVESEYPSHAARRRRRRES